jgi:predicted transcriptional regulator
VDLKEYFTLHTVNKAKWCKKHGISRASIMNILRGAKPTLDMAMRIYKATYRQVTPMDLGVLP